MRWWLLLAVPIAIGVYFYSSNFSSSSSEAKNGTPAVPSGAPPKKKGGKGGKGGDNAVVPVIGARAKKGNIGVYFNGLGSVTPISTVTIKSRVDGELMEVHFREGDTVHKGDLLMQIDPRPYQVQLTQAEGQQAKDQATLENARVDLLATRRC